MLVLNEKEQKLITQKASKIRSHIVKVTCHASSGHPGGSLSISDIIAVLYFYWLKHDPKKPDWIERDFFVLAKGHAAPAVYSALAESGYFPTEELKTLRQINSRLQGHPDMRSTPGIEMSTGSLGQGLSTMVGISTGLKLDKKKNRVYGILGDGECQEGQVWEAAMAASHFKCDNLTIFIDKNNLQIDGSTEEIMNVNPLDKKFESFGWEVININGHNLDEIISALEKSEEIEGKPVAIIADTVKGKGVSFMEHNLCFHGAPCSEKELTKAICELELD